MQYNASDQAMNTVYLWPISCTVAGFLMSLAVTDFFAWNINKHNIYKKSSVIFVCYSTEVIYTNHSHFVNSTVHSSFLLNIHFSTQCSSTSFFITQFHIPI